MGQYTRALALLVNVRLASNVLVPTKKKVSWRRLQVASQRRLERWAIDHEGYVAPYAETMLTIEEYYEMFK